MQLAKCIATLLLAAPIFGSDGTPTSQPVGLRVHEWGTFTSVAGVDGSPQPWMPLAAPADLPCFVVHLGAQCIKCAPGARPQKPSTVATSTVRMETPVLYFYAPRRMTLSVHVDFPSGWITEWYPQASLVTPQLNSYGGEPMTPVGGGSIDWKSVEVMPGTEPKFPTGEGASHYYAARNTDASPLFTSKQSEKLLFYRGIARMDVPLWVKVTENNRLELSDRLNAPLPLAIVFENRGGKIGYRLLRDFHGASEIEMPELTADLAQLKLELAGALISQGLFEKEALAMIETWRDSWFEEGMRVFYLVPRATVDTVLPLTVEPAPAATERVFVGRVELLSPYIRQTLTSALYSGDTAVLGQYGRFLEPFAREIPRGANANPATAAFFKARYDELRSQVDSPSCVR